MLDALFLTALNPGAKFEWSAGGALGATHAETLIVGGGPGISSLPSHHPPHPTRVIKGDPLGRP
jgi:hypothetical protein